MEPEGEEVETPTDVEGTETPNEVTPTETTPNETTPNEVTPTETTRATLTQLLGPDMPEWLRVQTELPDRALQPEDLERLPHEAKRVLGAVRKYAEQQADEVSGRAEELARKEQELAARERVLARRAADPLAWLKNPKVQELLQQQAGDAPDDPYSPEGLRHAARLEALQAMQEFLGRLGAAEREMLEAAAEAEAAAAEAAAREEDERYVAENLESLEDPEVFELTKQLMGRGFRVAEAHDFAVAKILAARNRKEDETIQAQARELARARLKAAGRLPSGAPATPESLRKDKEALNAFWRQHPEAAVAAAAEYRRRSAY